MRMQGRGSETDQGDELGADECGYKEGDLKPTRETNLKLIECGCNEGDLR